MEFKLNALGFFPKRDFHFSSALLQIVTFNEVISTAVFTTDILSQPTQLQSQIYECFFQENMVYQPGISSFQKNLAAYLHLIFIKLLKILASFVSFSCTLNSIFMIKVSPARSQGNDLSFCLSIRKTHEMQLSGFR